MANLQRYDNGNLELVIDIETGEVFASQSAIARMVSVSETSIRKFVTSYDIEVIKAEIPTSTGLKTSNLLNEDAIFQAFAKYNPELLIQCAKAGLRLYLHGLAGFKYEAKPTFSAPQTYIEALEALLKAEKEKQMLEAEKALLEQDNHALAEAVDELFDYSSIIRVAKFNQVSEKCFSWHKLKSASIMMGKEIKKVPCPRYGEKNLYSHDVWRLVYPNYSLPETTTLRLAS